MTLYLISNNLVENNLTFESMESVLEKRITRPLSIEGEKLAVKLVKKIDADVIYSSSYASAIGGAKYLAEYKNVPIIISSFLNDALIGEMGSRNIKMLRFMQERDFDFKFNRGESVNEVSKRLNLVMERIKNKNLGKTVAVFTHKRAIMGYLLPFLDKGFNLDDRLILSWNDKVIIDDVDNDIDIIKVTLEKGKIINVELIN